jgi:hypothetical protein
LLKIGWIDFSKAHRSKIMSVLDLLSKPGAVDELGISVIRDRLADILFPGTSTIQTRAKYFFIVPWLLYGLEKEKGLNANLLIRSLHEEEIKLIDVLAATDPNGVIGIESREKLKRKPSDIYWNGIKKYGIMLKPKLTIYEYARAVFQVHEKKQAAMLANKETTDDKDANLADPASVFWSIIPPKNDWKRNVQMKLTCTESEFLLDKIQTSPMTRQTLWASILRDYRKEAAARESFTDLSDIVAGMSGEIRKDYALARKFAGLIYGAHIRYNMLFFEALKRQNDTVASEWDEWVYEMKSDFDFSDWNESELLSRIRVTDYRLRTFIREWSEFARNINQDTTAMIDDLIRKREIQKKGLDRAKLSNTEDFIAFEGDWLGIGMLQYRWPNARQLLLDIMEGLGELNV